MNKLCLNRISCISLLLVILFLYSCSTKQSLVKTPVKEYNANQLIKRVQENEFDFNRIQAKMSIKVKSDKDNDINIKGQVRMQKDSIVWASLSLSVGLEIMRVKVTKDSVFFLNRTSSSYLSEDVSFLESIIPIQVTLKMLQDVLVGNNTYLRKGDYFKVSIDGESYKISEEGKVMVKNVWIYPELFKITRYNLKEFDDEKRKLQIEYGDFTLIGEKWIPTKIKINLQGDEQKEIEINYSNIIIDKDLQYPFSIPQKYDRIKK